MPITRTSGCKGNAFLLNDKELERFFLTQKSRGVSSLGFPLLNGSTHERRKCLKNRLYNI